MAPALWRPRRAKSSSRSQERKFTGRANPSRTSSALARRSHFFRPIVLTQSRVRCIVRFLSVAFLLIGAAALLIDRGAVRDFVGKTAESAKARLPLYTWAIGSQSSPDPAAPWKGWKGPHWLPSAAAGTNVSEEAAYLNYLVYRYGLVSDVPWYARRVRTEYVGGHTGPPPTPGNDDNLLQHHGYQYLRQIRPSLTKVKAQLMPGGFTTVRTDASVPDTGHPNTAPDAETEEDAWTVAAAEVEREPPVEPAVLRLPMARSARPDQIDASALLFGVSTTYARLSHAGFALVADWARWLTDGRGRSNGAGLLLSLHRAQPDEAEAVIRVLQQHGIDARVVVDPGNFDSRATNSTAGGHNDMEGNIRPDPPAVRYSNLLPLLHQYGSTWMTEEEETTGSGFSGEHDHDDGPSAKAVPKTTAQRSFYALVDDDIFFPSMDRLLGRLSQHASTHPHPHGGGDSSNDLWLGFPSMRSDWVAVDLATEAAAASAAASTIGLASASLSPPPQPTSSTPVPNAPPPALSPATTTASPMVVSYGGGAVFLSPPLAARMAELPCLRRTTDALHEAVLHAGIAVGKADAHEGEPWGEHLYHCATSSPLSSSSTAAAVQLRIVPSFYAPFDAVAYDHSGNEADPDNGVRLLQQYSGGLQPLTLHGYRRQHRFDAGFGHRVADVCGEDCFLQRFAFHDGWVLINGHSLERHDGLRVEPLRRASISPLLPPIGTTIGHGSDTVNSIRNWLKIGTGHAADGGSDHSSSSSYASEDIVGRRRREYERQQHFWSSRGMVVEDAERPRDVSVVRSRSRQPPAIWRLMDAYVAADGSLWQAYLRRRADTAGGGVRHGLDAADVPDAAADGRVSDWTAEQDQDSVIVLMWEYDRP